MTGVSSLLPAALWVVDDALRIGIALGPGFDSPGLRPEPESIVGLDLYEYFGTDDPQFAGSWPSRAAGSRSPRSRDAGRRARSRSPSTAAA